MQYRRLVVLAALSISSFFAQMNPATASAIFFTDRAAFDAVVGPTTLLTFDTLPDPILNPGHWEWHFDGSFVVGSDTTMGINSIPGTVCFCNVPNGVGGATLDPVWAVGLDITPLAPKTPVSTSEGMYILSEPQFLGFLYSDPSHFTIQNVFTLLSDGLGWSSFTIDNVAIKTVPEQSSIVLVVIGVAALVGWRWKEHFSQRSHQL